MVDYCFTHMTRGKYPEIARVQSGEWVNYSNLPRIWELPSGISGYLTYVAMATMDSHGA